jgi:hypothetical protein
MQPSMVVDTSGNIVLFYLPNILPPELIVSNSDCWELELMLYQESGNTAAQHLEMLAHKELKSGKSRWPNDQGCCEDGTTALKPGYLNVAGAYQGQGQV